MCSSLEKQDPTKQLREAGHPFNYIGSELVKLQGNFELVSSGVKALTDKIDETKDSLLEKVDSIFQKRFFWAVTLFAAIISFLYGTVGFIHQRTTLSSGTIYFFAIFIGVAFPVFVWLMFFRRK